MYQYINGVHIKEAEATKLYEELDYKRFEIIYYDDKYYHRDISMELRKVNVEDIGPMWIYFIHVSEEEYIDGSNKFGEIVKVVYDKLLDYLVFTYKFVPQPVLVDCYQ